MNLRKSLIALTAGLALVAGAVLASPAEAANGSKLKITKVYFDSPGSDTPVTNTKLKKEFVRITNTDTVTRSLTNWTLFDESNHVYTFGTTKLAAGENLWVRTGTGKDTAHTKYWNKSYYVWNNTADTAYLRNTSGGGGSQCGWKTSTPGNSILCNK